MGREHQFVAQVLRRLVGGEAGDVGGDLEEHASRFAVVDRVEVAAVHDWRDVEAGADDARIYNGIYSARADVPRVTVSATVPYTPIVGAIGFRADGLSLNASSQATVFGI